MSRLLPAFLLLISVHGISQNLSFTPGIDYYSTMEMELYSEHYLYVDHDGDADSTYLSWRLIENTCPEEWDFQMCDWQHCYSGFPNTGDMSGLSPGQTGNLRLIVNPYDIPGSGVVHFWVFPTGLMDEHVDVYFHLETIETSVKELSPEIEFSFTNSVLFISTIKNSDLVIFDECGKMIRIEKLSAGLNHLYLENLSSGIYTCITGGTPYRFFKP